MSSDVWLVCLGWFLGIVAAPITAYIQRMLRKEELEKSLKGELKNLAVRVMALSHLIKRKLGTYTKKDIERYRLLSKKYSLKFDETMDELFKRVLEVSAENLDEMWDMIRQKDSQNKLALKTYSVPYLTAIIDEVSVLTQEWQRNVFEIKTRLDILNQEIENAMYFFRLTFDAECMKSNNAAIESNIMTSYSAVDRQCQLLVDNIEVLLNMECV